MTPNAVVETIAFDPRDRTGILVGITNFEGYKSARWQPDVACER
jgi:hypothetical protein